MFYFGRCKENHHFLALHFILSNLFLPSVQHSDQQETDGRGTFPTSRLLCCSQLPAAQNGCAVRSSLSIKLHSNRVEICGVTRRKCAMFATEIFGRHGANSDEARRLRLNGCAVRLSRRCGDSVVVVRIGLNRRAVHGITADDKILPLRVTLLNV